LIPFDTTAQPSGFSAFTQAAPSPRPEASEAASSRRLTVFESEPQGLEPHPLGCNRENCGNCRVGNPASSFARLWKGEEQQNMEKAWLKVCSEETVGFGPVLSFVVRCSRKSGQQNWIVVWKLL